MITIHPPAVGRQTRSRLWATFLSYSLVLLTRPEMGRLDNLTEAVDAEAPLNPDRVLIDHTFDGEFAMAEMSPEDSAQYLCGQERGQVSGTSYHGVLFRFKRRDGGALGLLWAREGGAWKRVSYQVFEM